MLREIAHYGALLVGALFSVVVAVFAMSLNVIASRLRQLDSDLQAEKKDLIGKISTLGETAHAEPEEAIKQASTALSKAKIRSRRIRFNRWLLSLWGALYAPSLMLLSAFVMFLFTKIGILSNWEISIFSINFSAWETSIFYIALIVTVYTLIHLALVVELIHQAVLLPEVTAETSADFGPVLDVDFPDRSKVIIIKRLSECELEMFFHNKGEGQAENPSINVFVPNTFTHISGTMKPQHEGALDKTNMYYHRLGEALEGITTMKVNLGKVRAPTEPGDYELFVRLYALNSRVVKKSLQVLVQ